MSDEQKYADSLGVPVHEPHCHYCDSDAFMRELGPNQYPQHTSIESVWVNGADYAALRAKYESAVRDLRAIANAPLSVTRNQMAIYAFGGLLKLKEQTEPEATEPAARATSGEGDSRP